MKKTYLALMCMAAFAFAACGGNKDNKGGDATADGQATEQTDGNVTEAAGDDASALGKFEATLKGVYNISLDQIKPDFAFCEKNKKGGDLFYGDGTKRVVAHFVKQDDTNVTQDEFNAYGTNLYNLTKSIAQDGKNIYGFISADNLEGALKEKPLEKCIGKNEYDVDIIMTSWEFRIDDVFYNCSLSLGTDRSSDLEYIDVTIDKSLQKSLNESMEEADKALEQLGY